MSGGIEGVILSHHFLYQKSTHRRVQGDLTFVEARSESSIQFVLFERHFDGNLVPDSQLHRDS